MANLEIGPALEQIGRMIAEDVWADPDGVFLYAEFGEDWVEPSIFKDASDRIIYRYSSARLEDELMDLWEMEEPDKRWSSMQYDIKDGKFHVEFGYEDFSKSADSAMERREPLVCKRFGDKPVDYTDPEPRA